MKKALLAAVLAGIAMHAFAQTGIIREVTGEVEIKRAGSAAFAPAAVGDQVAPDTLVSAGFRSSAVIEVGSATLTIRPLTRLAFSEISSAAGEENMRVNLQSGRVRVDVSPPSGTTAAFTAQSPAATASVRGTSFEFTTTGVTVLSGSVEFAGARGGPVVVHSGGESFAGGASGMAADPTEIRVRSVAIPRPAGAEETAGGMVGVPGITLGGGGNGGGGSGDGTPAPPPGDGGDVDLGVDWRQ